MEIVPIEDSDVLYRRALGYFIKADGTVSSAAYKDRRKKPEEPLSVDLGKLCHPSETRARAGKGAFGVVSLLAILPRSLGFTVRHDPRPENPAHSSIDGPNDETKCRLLAAGSTPVLRPEPG